MMDRYVTLKVSDMKQFLTHEERQTIYRLAGIIAQRRSDQGRGLLRALVLETDWPEFMGAEDALSKRIAAEQAAKTPPQTEWKFPTVCDHTWTEATYLEAGGPDKQPGRYCTKCGRLELLNQVPAPLFYVGKPGWGHGWKAGKAVKVEVNPVLAESDPEPTLTFDLGADSDEVTATFEFTGTLGCGDNAFEFRFDGSSELSATANRHVRIFPDGDKWCALEGDDIQTGLSGFSDTPDAALTLLVAERKRNGACLDKEAEERAKALKAQQDLSQSIAMCLGKRAVTPDALASFQQHARSLIDALKYYI